MTRRIVTKMLIVKILLEASAVIVTKASTVMAKLVYEASAMMQFALKMRSVSLLQHRTVSANQDFP